MTFVYYNTYVLFIIIIIFNNNSDNNGSQIMFETIYCKIIIYRITFVLKIKLKLIVSCC